MKKLLLISVLFVSGLVKSQIIDTNNFNYSLLEKMVLQKINDYRKSKKLSELYYSEILRVNGSVKTSTANAKKDSAFHMIPTSKDQVLNKKLYNELYILTKGKCGVENPQHVDMFNGGEIICYPSGYFKTYENMSSEILNSWLNSPKHKEIIEMEYLTLNKIPGLFSCSVKKSKSGRFYITVNFVTVETLFG
jgi:uncharacterized protein YkwD